MGRPEIVVYPLPMRGKAEFTLPCGKRVKRLRYAVDGKVRAAILVDGVNPKVYDMHARRRLGTWGKAGFKFDKGLDDG